MTKRKTPWFWLCLSTLIQGIDSLSAQARVDFDREIRPLLADACFACHGPDAGARKAKLRLDTFEGATGARTHGAAIVPGDPEKSLVIERLTETDERRRMPPQKAHAALSGAEVALIERWIREGARYEIHWGFVAPTSPAAPRVKNGAWIREPLDAFVLAGLEAVGLEPAPEANPELLFRRACLVLTGLPPTPEELRSFESDPSPARYEAAVERWLASPAFGEHLAASWLDVARYSDTFGYQSDVERRVWPWRDWVVRAFNENLPFDNFLRWQLAGDLEPGATAEQRLATTFQRLHRQTNEGGSVEEEFRVEYVADRVNTFGTAMLGLTLECARCHDHKFDPLTQKEYYELSAFFSNIDESGLYSHFTNATPTPSLMLCSPDEEAKLVSARPAVALAEAERTTLRSSRRNAFGEWIRSRRDSAPPLTIAGLTGDFLLDGTGDARLANAADAKHPAVPIGNPKTVTGVEGEALQLDGENGLVFPGVGEFRATDPFTVSLWLRSTTASDRAVLLHRSRAWTDAGSQGWQLLLEDGRLWAAIVHFWPGDAVAIRATQPLPLGEWMQVTMTHDGSGRASGLRLYRNGEPAEVQVVRDKLQHGITGAGELVMSLGQRFRDRGFKDGEVDRLRVFDRELGALEVRHLHDGRALDLAAQAATEVAERDELLFTWWLDNHDSAWRDHSQRLRTLRRELADLVDSIPTIMVMEELAKPRITYGLERGAYDRRSEPVHPGTPRCLPAFPLDAPRDRRTLATWLTDPKHPLTARVAVNRLWSFVFGDGLVKTVENFGTQGTRPENHALLDHLTSSFVAKDWDLKGLLRTLVRSSTFRQSSRPNPATAERDPNGQLLGQWKARRLSAEMLRDQALAAAGLLSKRIGGPPVKPYQPEGLWEEKSGKSYVLGHGEELWRRSLYTFWRSTSPPPSLTLLDAATRDVCVARRQTTSTPVQTLVLLNDPQFVEAARVMAARVRREGGETDALRLVYAYRCLTGCRPDERELAILGELLESARSDFSNDPGAAKKLCSIGEAPRTPGEDDVETAAWTVVCSTIMNHDATVLLR